LSWHPVGDACLGESSAEAATKYYQATQATPEVFADDGLGPNILSSTGLVTSEVHSRP